MEMEKRRFKDRIKVVEDDEKIRLKNIQMKYDKGEITENEISSEDMDKLIEMYSKEAKELELDTERIKTNIKEMLNELKKYPI